MDTLFEFFKANPAATYGMLSLVILIVIVLALAIVLVTSVIIRGESIQLGGLTFGRQSRLVVQMGDENLPVNDRTAFIDTTGKRELKVHVTFDPPFKRPPKVAVSLNKIDLGDPQRHIINRLRVHAGSIRSNGFDLLFETWDDTRVYDAAASWIAVGE
jgi:H-type lectin domain